MVNLHPYNALTGAPTEPLSSAQTSNSLEAVLPAGTHVLTVMVRDRHGAAAASSATVTVRTADEAKAAAPPGVVGRRRGRALAQTDYAQVNEVRRCRLEHIMLTLVLKALGCQPVESTSLSKFCFQPPTCTSTARRACSTSRWSNPPWTWETSRSRCR